MGIIAKIQSDAILNNIPYAVIFELTRKCNLNCRHCYAVPQNDRSELSLDEIKLAINQLQKLGTLFITFSGGEPTVKPYFLEILDYTSDRKMCIQLFTNAVSIDDKMASELAKSNIFHIGISVYGATRQTHDNITRCQGSFDKTISAIHCLKNKGIYVVLKFIMMNLNTHEYAAMRELAKSFEVTYRMDVTITPRDDFSREPLSLTIDKDNMSKVFIDHEDLSYPSKKPKEDMSDLACVAGRSLMSINAYGDIYPCVQVPISCGNIRNSSLREIWHNSSFLKEFRQYPYAEKFRNGCPECKLREYCQRCPGLAFMETGDLYAPSPTACQEALLWKEIVDKKQKGKNLRKY